MSSQELTASKKKPPPLDQRRKYTRAKGTNEPKKYNSAPEITRRANNDTTDLYSLFCSIKSKKTLLICRVLLNRLILII